MKRIWIGLLAAILCLAFSGCDHSKQEASMSPDTDTVMEVIESYLEGRDDQTTVGTLIWRFDAETLKSPELSFDQLKEKCDRVSVAMYRDGVYVNILNCGWNGESWEILGLDEAEEALLQYEKKFGPGMLWSYNCRWNAFIDDDAPHAVEYSNAEIESISATNDLRVFLQCVTCENLKSAHYTHPVHGNSPWGWYDAEDVTYAAEYWNKKSNGILSNDYFRIALIVGTVGLFAFGIDRLLAVWTEKRRKSK